MGYTGTALLCLRQARLLRIRLKIGLYQGSEILSSVSTTVESLTEGWKFSENHMKSI